MIADQRGEGMELPVITSDTDPSSEEACSDSGKSTRSRLCDCVGVVCSCACAVHCAAMPFIIGWLPALGLTWLADEGFHQWMAGFCFLLAIAAVLPGYRRHRRKLVPMLAIAGVAVLATGAFAVSDECCQQCLAGVTESEAATEANAESKIVAASHRHSHDSSEGAGSDVPPCCEHGEHQESQTTVGEITVVQASILPPWLIPWVTPLGGCLLVVAHLMNRRCCNCCEESLKE